MYAIKEYYSEGDLKGSFIGSTFYETFTELERVFVRFPKYKNIEYKVVVIEHDDKGSILETPVDFTLKN